MMYSMRCLIIKNLCCLSFIFLFLGFIHFLLTSFLPSFLPDHYHFLPSLLTYFLPCSYLPSFRGFLSFLFPFFIFLLPSFLTSFLPFSFYVFRYFFVRVSFVVVFLPSFLSFYCKKYPSFARLIGSSGVYRYRGRRNDYDRNET